MFTDTNKPIFLKLCQTNCCQDLNRKLNTPPFSSCFVGQELVTLPEHLRLPPVFVGQELVTLPEHLSLPPVFVGQELVTLPEHLSLPPVFVGFVLINL